MNVRGVLHVSFRVNALLSFNLLWSDPGEWYVYADDDPKPYYCSSEHKS